MGQKRSLVGVNALVAAFGMSLAVVSSAEEPAPTRAEAVFEIKFMTEMIDHHMMAIMMAEMCLEEAVHEDLRAMCEDIIAVQTTELQTMQSWLLDWYELSYEPELSPSMERMMERHASMSPEDFEIHFMQMMIRHHWQAIQDANQCTRRAYHGELIEMCESIVSAQTAEIATMQEWLCEWDGRCRQGPQVQ